MLGAGTRVEARFGKGGGEGRAPKGALCSNRKTKQRGISIFHFLFLFSSRLFSFLGSLALAMLFLGMCHIFPSLLLSSSCPSLPPSFLPSIPRLVFNFSFSSSSLRAYVLFWFCLNMCAIEPKRGRRGRRGRGSVCVCVRVCVLY